MAEKKLHYRLPGTVTIGDVGRALCNRMVPEEQIVSQAAASCMDCLHIWARKLDSGGPSTGRVYLVGSITYDEVLAIWEDAKHYARDRSMVDFAEPMTQGAFSTAERAMASGIKALNADKREHEEEILKDMADGGELLPGVLDNHMAQFRWVDKDDQLVDQNWCPLERELREGTGEPIGRPRHVIYLESPAQGNESDDELTANGWRMQGCVVVEELTLDEEEP